MLKRNISIKRKKVSSFQQAKFQEEEKQIETSVNQVELQQDIRHVEQLRKFLKPTL